MPPEFHFRYSDRKKPGKIIWPDGKELSYYNKKLNIYCPKHRGIHQESAEKDIRYCAFHDQTDLVRASLRYGLGHLSKTKPASWFRPSGFDHTSQYRKPNETRACIHLTEPYHIDDKTLKHWNELSDKFHITYKIFEKSEHSLYYPNQTFMVFWWCPDLYTPDWNVLMGHQEWSKLKDKLIYSYKE